jgi:hypothetical protein
MLKSSTGNLDLKVALYVRNISLGGPNQLSASISHDQSNPLERLTHKAMFSMKLRIKKASLSLNV